MKIKKISLKNIRTYENQEILFPEGSTLLSGDIGAGKSSILLALEFALFGLEKGNLSGAALLRKGADLGQVMLELEIDGKEIKIERNLKKKSNGFSQEKSVIYIDNEKYELSTEEIKHKVLTLLEYPLEFIKKTNFLYRFTVYTPQEEMKQILLENAEDRINTLRKIFGIDKYKTIEENIDVISKAIKESVSNKEGKTEGLEKLKQESSVKKEEKEKIYKELEKTLKEHDEISKKLEEKQNSIKKIEDDIRKFNRLREKVTEKKMVITNFKEKIASLKENIESYDKKIILLKEELKDKSPEEFGKIAEKIKNNQNQTEELQKQYMLLEKKIYGVEMEIKRIEKSEFELKDLNVCPTCKQQVSLEYRNSISESAKKEIDEKSENLSQTKMQSFEIKKQLQELRTEFDSLCGIEKKFAIDEFKFRDLNEKISEQAKFAKEKETAERRLNEEKINLSEIAKEIGAFHDVETGFEKSRRELDEISKNEREIAIKKASFDQSFRLITMDLKEMEKEILGKEKIISRIVYLKNLNEWLSDDFLLLISKMEKIVMLTVHHEFNSLFEKWFSILAENLSARLDENFTPIIEQNGYEIDYAHLSGGERTGAALAYRLSLNQVINSIMSKIKTHDLLILDEPTDGFSQQQLEKIRDILEEIKLKQLIIVSHEPQIESFVENIIRFQKENNLTKIQQ